MAGINTGRLLLGGLVAAVVIFLIEGAATPFYMSDMLHALQQHNLSMGSGASGMLAGALISLLMGIGLIFFYAAARPRFGAGVKTAMIVATVSFFTGYFAGLIGYQAIGLYPTDMLVRFGVTGLVEMNLAAIAGAWVYRE
ncbi:MAG: hypothetical protein HC872_05895 [Gammaproteobacteria bacterium]|nr:hypothetical protein [Gammaproteobacteria bacterium]